MYKFSTHAALALALVAASFAPAGAQSRRDYVVDNDVFVEATLDRTLNTKRIRPGDRFTASVTSPREFQGATLHGVVVDAERSGRLNDDAEMTLEFDRIELRNGRTYDFAGTVERVRTVDGTEIEVNDEGEITREDTQADRTIRRTGIGAIAGAIIGGIAGGGDGAAAGAAIGGGAGAGSVAIQGRRDVELVAGTRMIIRAAAPLR
jgi:hypothetical protein